MLTTFQKNLLTVGVLVVILFIVLTQFDIVVNPFSKFQKLNDQISSLRDALNFTKKANTDLKERYANTVSESTTHIERLESRLHHMTTDNDSLKVLVNQLKGELSGIHSGEGNIEISDTIEVVITDSLVTAKDDFIDIVYTPHTDSLSWQLHAIIRINGVEKTDWYGNRRYVSQAFLKSKISDRTLNIPYFAHYLTHKPKVKLFRYNPAVQGQVTFGVNGLSYGLSAHFFTFGVTKYPQDTYFYIGSFGVVSNFKTTIKGVLIPFSYNTGTVLPLITDLNISPAITFDKGGLGLEIGVGVNL